MTHSQHFGEGSFTASDINSYATGGSHNLPDRKIKTLDALIESASYLVNSSDSPSGNLCLYSCGSGTVDVSNSLKSLFFQKGNLGNFNVWANQNQSGNSKSRRFLNSVMINWGQKGMTVNTTHFSRRLWSLINQNGLQSIKGDLGLYKKGNPIRPITQNPN